MKHTLIYRFLLALVLSAWLGASYADTPALGAAAPDFKLQDQNGKWRDLKEFRGKWLALYFYPKDQTPGCTTQACEFRDNVFAFRDANAQIVGISVDDVESHKKFSEKHGLPFPILADPTKETARKYGVLKQFLGTMELAKRDTFLIDPEGRIVKHYREVDPKGHSQVVLNDIKAMQQKRRAERRTANWPTWQDQILASGPVGQLASWPLSVQRLDRLLQA